ncbi:MAG: hypothetical protein JNM55_10205 [Anaerolineales bacterium]|nr:hypothetical protein [Anaerolineales bacterium]
MEIPESILRIYAVAVIISALVIAVEGNGMMFSPSVLFLLGFKIKTMNGININLDCFEIGKEYTTSKVKFVRLSKNSCVFSRRFGFFSNGNISIKGEILNTNSGTILIWRIPLGSTMFFSLWFLGWISPIFGIFQLTASQIFTADFLFNASILFGTSLLFLFTYFASLNSEKKKAQIAFSEILFLSLRNRNFANQDVKLENSNV